MNGNQPLEWLGKSTSTKRSKQEQSAQRNKGASHGNTKKEGGKQAHGKENNIVRFKLSLGRGMNSEDEVLCTHFAV